MFRKSTSSNWQGQRCNFISIVPIFPHQIGSYHCPYAPWCWNIYQHLPQKSPSFVDRYTSTMEHKGWDSPLFPRSELVMMLFFSFDLLPGFYRGYYDIQWSTWCLLSALLVSSGTLLLWRPKNQAPNGAGWRWTLWSFSKKKQGKHQQIFGFFRGILPSGELTVCNWKWPFIVRFPIKNGGSFHCKLLVHQRVIGNLETSPQFVAKRSNEGVWLLRRHIGPGILVLIAKCPNLWPFKWETWCRWYMEIGIKDIPSGKLT